MAKKSSSATAHSPSQTQCGGNDFFQRQLCPEITYNTRAPRSVRRLKMPHGAHHLSNHHRRGRIYKSHFFVHRTQFVVVIGVVGWSSVVVRNSMWTYTHTEPFCCLNIFPFSASSVCAGHNLLNRWKTQNKSLCWIHKKNTHTSAHPETISLVADEGRRLDSGLTKRREINSVKPSALLACGSTHYLKSISRHLSWSAKHFRYKNVLLVGNAHISQSQTQLSLVRRETQTQICRPNLWIVQRCCALCHQGIERKKNKTHIPAISTGP